MGWPIEIELSVPRTAPRTYRVERGPASVPYEAVLRRLAATARQHDGDLPGAVHTLLQELEAGLELASEAVEALTALADDDGRRFCPSCFHPVEHVRYGHEPQDAGCRATPARSSDVCSVCASAPSHLMPDCGQLTRPMARSVLPVSCWDAAGLRPLVHA